MDRKLPLPGHMPARVLARLILGEKHSHRSFDDVAHSYRLSAPIERLRNFYGWPIDDVWLDCYTGDAGRRARYKRYFLSPETLATITDEERAWAFSVLRKERERAAA